MRAMMIEDDDLLKFHTPARRMSITSDIDPLGEQIEELAPIEAVLTDTPFEDLVIYHFKIEVTAEDLARIARDGHFWMTQVGEGVQPFNFHE